MAAADGSTPLDTSSVSSLPTDGMSARKKRFVFALLCTELFIGQLGYAVFSPFFPDEAKDKDVSEAVSGWIFGSFQLVVLVFTPISMKLVPVVGPTALLNASNFLIGGSNVAFGFLWYLSAGAPFTIACFIARIFAGIGVSVSMVVGYGLLPFLFGDKLSTGSSILETVIGLAFIAAPVLGSMLYTLGGGPSGYGYVVPFVALGGLHVVLGVYALIAFPKLPMPDTSDSRITFFSPRVIVPCIICTLSAGAIEYMSPTLELLVTQDPFGFSVGGVGSIFAVCSGVYVVVGPLVGIFDDRLEGRFAIPTMGVGILFVGAGYILIGPAGFASALGLELGMLNLWAGVVMIGLSSALGLIPTYNNMYKWAKHNDEDDKANATSVLYNLFYAFGAWLGPTAGGWLGDSFGIAQSYTLFGTFSVVAGLIVVLFFLIPSVRRSEDMRELSICTGEVGPAPIKKQPEGSDLIKPLASATATATGNRSPTVMKAECTEARNEMPV